MKYRYNAESDYYCDEDRARERLNISQLEAEFEITRTTFQKYLKHLGAPKPDTDGKYDPEEVLEFMYDGGFNPNARPTKGTGYEVHDAGRAIWEFHRDILAPAFGRETRKRFIGLKTDYQVWRVIQDVMEKVIRTRGRHWGI